MDNKRTDGSQSGRSMVEMLGVLAIIGVLSIGGIAGYSRAMIKFKVGKSLDQISMLVASIQTLYSGQRNYSGLTLKEAISYGVISPDMKASDSTVTNVFAGSVLPITISEAVAKCTCREAPTCAIGWYFQ